MMDFLCLIATFVIAKGFGLNGWWAMLGYALASMGLAIAASPAYWPVIPVDITVCVVQAGVLVGLV